MSPRPNPQPPAPNTQHPRPDPQHPTPGTLHPIRERIEAAELRLSPLAAKSRYSRGRRRPDELSSVRTIFQQDRDRIVHSKAFRRLKHKTQVFVAPQGDHYVTRLTHTIQVQQIARTIARALNLNEDLAEAIALCHDLGHPPFGHAGERALDSLLPDGFRHHEQTLRIVDHLEKAGAGLNLTWEVRDALTKHSKPRSSIAASETGFALTLEGQVVKLADGIAYLNHDLGDAIRAGLFAEHDLPEVVFAVLGDRESTRVDTMVCDVIGASWEAVRAGESSCGQTEAELHRLLAELAERAEAGESLVTMSPPVLAATDALREFMFERVYLSPDAQAEDRRVERVVVALYTHFCARPAELPVELREDIAGGGSLARAVGDYLAGMTDRFALRVFDVIARVGA